MHTVHNGRKGASVEVCLSAVTSHCRELCDVLWHVLTPRLGRERPAVLRCLATGDIAMRRRTIFVGPLKHHQERTNTHER